MLESVRSLSSRAPSHQAGFDASAYAYMIVAASARVGDSRDR
jgi:hypothetical protein